MLHGGGTTAYEQVNETHLHATLQKRMKDDGIAVFYGQLEDFAAAGATNACSHTRQDLCMSMKHVWENIDHQAISHTGYMQTGPLLPLEGPIYMTDLYIYLRELLQEMCPHDDPEQVGTEIREEARQLVDRSWGKTVFS